MEINITKKFENKLLNRDEYKFTVSFDGATPQRIQIRDKFSAVVNSKPNLVVIKKIENKSGEKRVYCTANVYKDEETLKKIEPKYIIERHAKKEIGKEKEEKK